VESDLPFSETTFTRQIELFRVDGPGNDTVTIHHHFELPDLKEQDLGKELYRKTPWVIYQQGEDWLYLGILPESGSSPFWKFVRFNQEHTYADIYSDSNDSWRAGNLHSLTLFPTDQILIGRLLNDRKGCYLHSAGAILAGEGLIFVGHSETGKSTTTRLLMEYGSVADHGGMPTKVEILCDDRNIVRKHEGGWLVYGSWSHGDIPDVSPAFAPLRAICFIEQASENNLIPLTDQRNIRRRLLACVIKPFVTSTWWQKTLDIIEQMASELPCYIMHFDKSGAIVQELVSLALNQRSDEKTAK
jgi:hypothetical protein